jgi:hypothetical protein
MTDLRIEDDLDPGVGDAGHRSHLLLHVGRQLPGGWTVGRGERHADVNGALAVDGHAVNQSELVDVDGVSGSSREIGGSTGLDRF